MITIFNDKTKKELKEMAEILKLLGSVLENVNDSNQLKEFNHNSVHTLEAYNKAYPETSELFKLK